MAIIGGSVQAISLDGREFAPPGDTDIAVTRSGDKNETKINGNLTTRVIKEAMGWKMDGCQVACSALDDDHGALQALANRADFPIVITFADGSDLAGVGSIEGDLQYSTQNAVASFGLAGGGSLSQ